MGIPRFKVLRTAFILISLFITSRLFYVQVVKADDLKAQGKDQYQIVMEIIPKRGNILASDMYPLATSTASFLLFADPSLVEEPERVITELLPLIYKDSSPSAIFEESQKIKTSLKNIDNRWLPLKSGISHEEKKLIEDLAFKGLGFEEQASRFYPESSMSAQLLGFVGKDDNGFPKGYFGLEGYYNLELSGNAGTLTQEKDLLGLPILIGKKQEDKGSQGRHLVTSIDRSAQFLVEQKLKDGIEKYGAKSGTISIIEPQTGRILAMASFPNYAPSEYWKFDASFQKNPIISESYEPGSTFKVLVMAAALNEGVITKDSICDKCSGPLQLDKYMIKTWDNKYHANSNMTDVILHSDNVGMVFIGDKLGTDKFLKYFKLFGFDRKTNIDLQEEVAPPVKPDDRWTFIDRATATFGQGIAVTPIQMLKAITAIANGGKIVTPRVVDKVIDAGEEIIIPREEGEKVLGEKAVRDVTEMMVQAVDKGEAKWAKPKAFRIAGKTGTAQIAVSGHYDEEKTIASFIGFAPADSPKFAMLVTLREPQSSQWGSETAAPLWFSVAKDLFRLWNITP
jgi:cell division protein FtsI (penicillin-binding protein 3)